ncbi:unnamed protein product [Adineta steineri]|uniref:Uncharacterized protein n=1 Tax=Adineta steineri TaxID=433720 RepID=A0A814YGF9_9BILA|nr:unnamed protein product [Adineta steineri]CAF1362051.1 unnamed protein product [Adineta steineri]
MAQRSSHSTGIDFTKSDYSQQHKEQTDDKTNCIKRVSKRLLGYAKSKTCLFGLVIGLLTGGIALAAVTTIWKDPITPRRQLLRQALVVRVLQHQQLRQALALHQQQQQLLRQVQVHQQQQQLLRQVLVLRQQQVPPVLLQQQQVPSSTATNPFTPSTVTCANTVATPCTTTTTLVASCQSYEVSWNNHCYYLDGSGGSCITGYSQGTNAVLTCIATQFAGKTYRSTISNNCCVWTSDTYECFILNSNCNSAGPFTSGPSLGCTDAQQQYGQQLTFCGSN